MNKTDQELQLIERELAMLDSKRIALLEKKKALLLGVPSTTRPDIDILVLSTQQKVGLFTRLFRGRDDIHAVRWQNKQGRSGYSVGCANEWQQGLCNKPKIKCGECCNRAFLPLNEQAIYDHLSGKSTIGLYPLSLDDQCWLLAVDFDKSDWQQAVTAFRQACCAWGICCAIERSRSGDGAHVWIFFDQAITAKDARRFGFALLDKAMEHHAGLSFDSYDRLFPSQDSLPTGGFGNLIALPLQRSPRGSGNSVFIDEGFVVYPDQWVFLSSIQKTSVKQVNDCLALSDSVNADLGEDSKPWERSLPVDKDIIDGCPEVIEIVLANRIYFPVDNFPQALLARLKRMASFSNPVFFKTQALRFSTHGIPRFICLAHIEQGYLSLPRGCFDDAVALLEQQNIRVSFDDKRRAGQKLRGLKFTGVLRKDQKKAVSEISRHDVGVLQAPPAFGKTVVAIGLIHKRKVNTLILVHSRALLDQWKERLMLFLTGADIGIIGGGKRKASGQVDIATYQSLINRKDNSVDELLFQYGQIIIDECHHISAPNYEMLLGEVHAKYVVGVTATPERQDGHQPIIFMQAGPIRHIAKSSGQQKFEQRVITRALCHTPPLELTQSDTRLHIADVYRWLMNHKIRNQQIVDDIVSAVIDQRNPIVLTERRDHALLLGDLLGKKEVDFEILRGGMKVREREAVMAALESTQVLIATGKYIGEGFDLPKLDTLFLALPISWKGSLAQYAGRIHRRVAGKEKVIIYDYVDYSLPMLQRMFQRRQKGYDALGYAVIDSQVDGLVQAPLQLID